MKKTKYTIHNKRYKQDSQYNLQPATENMERKEKTADDDSNFTLSR